MTSKARAKAQAAPQIPFDMRRVWNGGAKAFGFSEKASSAWFDGVSQMQAEATRFFNSRVGKDAAAIAEFGQCTTAAEAFAMQVRYVDDVFNDYAAESQRMLELAGDAVRSEVAAIGGPMR